MVQKTNKTKSRLGREFRRIKNPNIDAPMGEGKEELFDSLIKKAKENEKKAKYVHEVGDKVEGLPKPRNLEHVNEELRKETIDANINPEITNALINYQLKWNMTNLDMAINDELKRTNRENEKKAKFFRRLNKVLDNKLVKPSIIIEYINQYQKGE